MTTTTTTDEFQATTSKRLDDLERLLDPNGLAQEVEQAKAKAAEEASLRRQAEADLREAEARLRRAEREKADLERQIAAMSAQGD